MSVAENVARQGRVDGEQVAIDLVARARELRKGSTSGLPHSPVLGLAVELAQKIDRGLLDVDTLRAASKRLMDRAASRRAERLSRKSRQVGADPVDVFETCLRDALGDAPDWETFRERWSRPKVGVVFTAHPTFAFSKEMSKAIVSATQAVIDPSSPQSFNTSHLPDPDLTLADEHRQSSEAIVNFHKSFRRLAERFYDVMRETHPDTWKDMLPGLATVASWVGYDLDGRTDIHWTDTFQFRIAEKAATLSSYRDRLLAIAQSQAEDSSLRAELLKIEADFKRCTAACAEVLEKFNAADGSVEELADAANTLTRHADGIISVVPTVDKLVALAKSEADDRTAREVLVLATMMSRFGLAGRHMHMRINAKQLHNAFRAHVGETWAQDLADHTAVTRIAKMIDGLEPLEVNFGSLMDEPTTAIREFAAAKQLLKHVDADTPIRFLIAECEEPATILIAVYFARLFGVAHNLDISPLFETDEGLDHGADMMERLFRQQHYVDYVRERGRISIQTGFSDAGRFIGQMAATISIETLQSRIATLVKDYGLDDLEMLIFNTHGESMGRGNHPGGYAKRFRYVLSDQARYTYRQCGIDVYHEISFQGGDGYLHFGSMKLATAALTAFIVDAEHVSPTEGDDPLYRNEAVRLDFYSRLREYHHQIYRDEGYRALLHSFGPNLLVKTGSRAVKRQQNLGGRAERDPGQMRAIPNNAILQQFGYTSNVVAGLGTSFGDDPAPFIELVKKSNRMRSLMEMACNAKRLSSTSTLLAYAALLDSGFWTLIAYSATERQPVKAYETIATHLLDDHRASEISRFAQFLRLDALRMHRIFDELGMDAGRDPAGDRLEQDTLHAIRIALIMSLFVTAAQMPKFATSHDVSPEQFMDAALSLDIEAGVDFLRKAFPSTARVVEAHFDEDATYDPWNNSGYKSLEANVFQPMVEIYGLIREIGVGISHNFDAWG